ncbi:DNA-3-methyladenine glycosylase family protein [Candidatus Nitrosacidococcus sp. I8]|uniref:DNA-3-methyladenine glycosylase family protein n=1 Tax=Candidatus Nitrosacidococcus sp. I8 TaxID=2942908 RepID=UPI00222632C6|nr:hypothetical protein [Candidatus Nitrosacidococcus sp. I8]CAH9018582.1 hypothetical protein NURINAE_01009 [Candidatus Nitrosacidococcus sp. I8]
MAVSYLGYLDLPRGFHGHNILVFHDRDSEQTAERVDYSKNLLEKGILWQGLPACLTLQFKSKQVVATLQVDGDRDISELEALSMVRRMLGLNQNINNFEKTYYQHPQLGALLKKQAGLRVPVSSTPFEALVWAITGQQISLAAAISIRRKLIKILNIKHSSGIYCHPDAEAFSHLDQDKLRSIGYAKTKAKTLLNLSQGVMENTLPLDNWLAQQTSVEEISQKLIEVPGIGPWTISYGLLRGYSWLDGSLHGDAGMRRGLQKLLGLESKITAEEAEKWLAPFSPWRALVAAHLWMSL